VHIVRVGWVDRRMVGPPCAAAPWSHSATPIDGQLCRTARAIPVRPRCGPAGGVDADAVSSSDALPLYLTELTCGSRRPELRARSYAAGRGGPVRSASAAASFHSVAAAFQRPSRWIVRRFRQNQTTSCQIIAHHSNIT
jgi:hypothetical protein